MGCNCAASILSGQLECWTFLSSPNTWVRPGVGVWDIYRPALSNEELDRQKPNFYANRRYLTKITVITFSEQTKSTLRVSY
jgi:hypothetical protein